MRDLDVMIDHLEVIQRRATHRTAAAWLTQRLIESRETTRAQSLQAESPNRVLAKLGNWWGLRIEVIESSDQVHTLLSRALHLQLDSFAEQANLLANKQPDIKHDPHQVRIAGKALRYTLEMAKREGHAIPGAIAKAFKRMQDALGLWHDFVVLTERALRESLDALLAHHDTLLQRQVLNLSRMTLDRAGKELDRFSALWAQEGPELLTTIRASVPQPSSAREPLPTPPANAPAAPLAEPQAEPDVSVPAAQRGG
jgi:CHAD domain-containing protein